jgi:hypothetical protein
LRICCWQSNNIDLNNAVPFFPFCLIKLIIIFCVLDGFLVFKNMKTKETSPASGEKSGSDKPVDINKVNLEEVSKNKSELEAAAKIEVEIEDFRSNISHFARRINSLLIEADELDKKINDEAHKKQNSDNGGSGSGSGGGGERPQTELYEERKAVIELLVGPMMKTQGLQLERIAKLEREFKTFKKLGSKDDHQIERWNII